MSTTASPPVAAGEAAPDFALPAVSGPATVSLADYRGRSPLLLALMVGLWCPFCRRQLVQLGQWKEKLEPIGVESLAVVATALDNARLYFKFRPTRLRLATDPELTTHRAYRVPKPEPTPALIQELDTLRINPGGWLPEPMSPGAGGKYLQERDPYPLSATDQADVERQWPQLKGLFLIDRGGIVRWADIECSSEGLAGIGQFPSEDVVLEAARACV